MTRSIRAALVAAVAVAATHSTGCVTTKSDCASGNCGGAGSGRDGSLIGDATLQERYNSRVDPCWPERYAYQARQATLSPFANQVANGQAIDQTIFNGDFDPGTAVLTVGGRQKLDTLARRRPVDGRLYVQTSRDIAYDPAKRDEYVKTKTDLDAARADAVQGYLAATTTGRKVNFDVAISDPQDMQMPVVGPSNAVRGYAFQFQSGVTGIAGNGFVSGAGGQNLFSNVTGGNFGNANTGNGGNLNNLGSASGNPNAPNATGGGR